MAPKDPMWGAMEELRGAQIANRLNQQENAGQQGPAGILAGGNLGRIVQLGQLINGGIILKTQPETLLTIQGDNAKAEVMSIGLIAPTTSASATQIRVKGILEFGNAGVQCVAEIDFCQGVVLSVPGSFVRLSAIDDGSVGLAGAVNVTCGAFVSYKNISTSRPPKRTRYRDTALADTASVVFTVPAFASQFWVERTPSNPMTVSVQRSGLGALYDVNVARGAAMDPLPLSNDAANIVVTNTDGAGLAIDKMRVIFELSL